MQIFIIPMTIFQSNLTSHNINQSTSRINEMCNQFRFSIHSLREKNEANNISILIVIISWSLHRKHLLRVLEKCARQPYWENNYFKKSVCVGIGFRSVCFLKVEKTNIAYSNKNNTSIALIDYYSILNRQFQMDFITMQLWKLMCITYIMYVDCRLIRSCGAVWMYYVRYIRPLLNNSY